ncbi:uncharacterized protein F4822DRAFT_434473 [Hypoxylon trugodes]|uniref:uncharacterized protein n=1 Tax=Hypoxylon trugodes TaxID=326681 RepID=UPI00219283D2|nr:uncharacterized protein F4822DRAFT_434473 [Hypoxylon trugodes]KAI1383352.1 hypothetical protein F4822DRAFT_434473 [Hypoxylon trugodes]
MDYPYVVRVFGTLYAFQPLFWAQDPPELRGRVLAAADAFRAGAPGSIPAFLGGSGAFTAVPAPGGFLPGPIAAPPSASVLALTPATNLPARNIGRSLTELRAEWDRPYTGDWACSICGQAGTERLRHLTIHVRDCPFCLRTFQSNVDVANHIIREHKGDDACPWTRSFGC